MALCLYDIVVEKKQHLVLTCVLCHATFVDACRGPQYGESIHGTELQQQGDALER